MKRILFFNDSLTLGGTEKLLVDLLNHLVEKDCHITLLLPELSDNNILLDKLSPKIEIKYLYPHATPYWKKLSDKNLMIFFPRIFAKFKNIKAKEYDEVVCFKEGFYARIFSKMNIPKILWIHNILYNHTYGTRSFKEKLSVWLNKKQIKITRKSYDRYNKVICVSDAAKQAYLNILHDGLLPDQDIRVLYNAVDLTRVLEKSKSPIHNLPQGQTNFILITRLSPEKRTDRLINAAARLQEEGYDFHAYIIGEGLDNEDMRITLKERQLGKAISLMGRIDNPYPYILQSNWLLCVSERESFSLTILEAMALNTPVITTDCGGPADIIAKGKYGILVENSGEGVYRGMKMVLDNPTLSVKYSTHLAEAVSRFDYNGWLKSAEGVLGI